MVSTKILGSMTVFNIENNNKCLLSSISVYYYDFWRSCDTEDWSNDAENTALITEINYILTHIHIENSYFKLLIIFHNFTIFTVFLSIRVFFQKINIYIFFFECHFYRVWFSSGWKLKRKEKKRKRSEVALMSIGEFKVKGFWIELCTELLKISSYFRWSFNNTHEVQRHLLNVSFNLLWRQHRCCSWVRPKGQTVLLQVIILVVHSRLCQD